MKSSAALAKEVETKGGQDPWRGFKPGDWRTSIGVRDFIVRNVTPYTGDEKFLAPASAKHQSGLGQAAAVFPGRAEEGRSGGRRKDPLDTAGAQARLHRPRQRSHRRPADRSAVQARDLPVRRSAHGRSGPEGGRLRGRSAGPRSLHQISQDTQRRRVRRLYARDHAVPEVRHHHRPARCLWPRAHHRRLPPRRTLRRRSAARGQARIEREQIDDMWPTDEVIRQREELAEQIRALKDLAAMAKLYGFDISQPATNAREAFQWTYFAYLGAIKEANGAAMSIGRISTFLDIYIERDLKRRHAGRSGRPGTMGPAGAEAAHRAFPAHAGLRCAVQRRSLLGDRMRRRDGSRRPPAGDQEQLSHAAHALQSRSGAGAEYHGALVEHMPGPSSAFASRSAAIRRRCNTRTTT